ncbi:MAG TPA: hypothetical protein VKI44_05070 [Acetobacteraceae bacterium]|nr:hypothetical protein [Acetobacteraceae bacterium]
MNIAEPRVIEERRDEHVEPRRLSSTPNDSGHAVSSPQRRRRFRFLLTVRDWIAVVLFYALWPILALMSAAPILLWLLGARL